MNLHIVPDSKFSNTFYHNLRENGLLANNTMVVRTNHAELRYIDADVPFAKLYSSKFDRLTGDTHAYEKVFIHQLAPLMYRWIARRRFQELNWMVWGTDLYNLPFVDYNFYESYTQRYSARPAFADMLYRLKVYVTNMPFKRNAYAKVNHVLTWMKSEFDFACQHIPELKAGHQFFFYENQVPYQQLDAFSVSVRRPEDRLKIIVGNSGTPTNNHLDAIKQIQESHTQADLLIPISYGDKGYTRFLKENVSFYTQGKIEFVEKFMDFPEYVAFLSAADALVMNHIRPQGYGNIFMMMYLGKTVFLNDQNVSIPDLERSGIQWRSLKEVQYLKPGDHVHNKERVLELLSHSKLQTVYGRLFAAPSFIS